MYFIIKTYGLIVYDSLFHLFFPIITQPLNNVGCWVAR